MALIENLEREGRQEFLRDGFRSALEVLKKDRFRPIGSSVATARHVDLGRRIMRYFLATLSIICVLGCIPHSDNPLTDFNKQEIDSSILGSWYWKDENETIYVHIGRGEESKLLRVVMLDIDAHGDLEVSEYSGHTSSLEGNKYLNIKLVRPAPDKIVGYMFVKYKLASDSLGFSLMDSRVAEKAIRDGALKGEVTKGKWISSIHITEGQKELQNFIVRKDKELFQEMKYLARLELTSSSINQSGQTD
jgi:hypothetical protein